MSQTVFVFKGVSKYFKFNDTITTFLKSNDLTPLIKIEGVNNSKDAEITFTEESDDGSFITFGGLLFNTKSGNLVLGYNANGESYIPIVSLVDLLNKILSPDRTILDLNSTLYIVEQIKLNHGNFDVIKYIKGMTSGSTYSKESIILNYMDEFDLKQTSPVQLAITNNKDFYKLMFSIFSVIIQYVDTLSRELFSNFIAEDNRSAVLTEIKNKSTTSLEAMYLNAVGNKGVNPVFARELSSCGVGRKRRNNLISYGGLKSDADAFAILSGWSFIDVWDSTSFNTITQDRIRSYNILDILRGIGREQDLYFSYDAVFNSQDTKFFDVLMKKLELTAEVTEIGADKFFEHIKNFSRNVSLIRDMGGNYSSKVKPTQKDFANVASKSMINSGRILDKVSKRILSKF